MTKQHLKAEASGFVSRSWRGSLSCVRSIDCTGTKCPTAHLQGDAASRPNLNAISVR